MGIREYIINNFKDDDIDSLKNAIIESINERDEETLPGMGVFFEIVWDNSNDENKQQILNILKEHMK